MIPVEEVMTAFAVWGAAFIILALVFTVLGILRKLGITKSGARPRRHFVFAMIAVLGVVACGVGDYALLYFVLIPSKRSNAANMPGTLTTIGQQAPDIEIMSIDGPTIRLSDLRGRVVLLNFFATWCGPCQMELPGLQTIWDDLHGNDELRMFIIGREESAETVRAFKDKNGFTFPMASDLDRSAFGRFATESIPRTYLISRNGKIVYQCTGYFQEELIAVKNLIEKELRKQE
jgi:peroxiredoxin